MKIKRSEGNGQAQCKRCKDKGKWNVQWYTFLYEIEGEEGLCCYDCIQQIKIENLIESRERHRQELLEWECINPNQ